MTGKILDAIISAFCMLAIVAATFVAAGTGIWISALTVGLIWRQW
jgi:hypothetical protein